MKDSVLLADPNSKSWKFAQEVCEKLNSKKAEISLYKTEIIKFADGESYVRVLNNVREKKCYFIHDSSKPANDWLVELMLVNDALKRASASSVIDVLPYMKYSRQDRKDKSRVPISAKVIADSIAYRADKVITTDLHVGQIQGFYNKPVDNLHAFPAIVEYLKNKHPEYCENAIIVSPDAGGVPRARAFAKRLDKEIALVDKRREKAGEVAGVNIVGDVNGKNAIIVDDIIDSGNTLIEVSNALRKNGASKVYACCTHGLLSKNAAERLPKSLDGIIITDSIPQNNLNEIQCVSLTDLYADAIYRTEKGMSLSELFEDAPKTSISV
ncbi:MAG: ribose-phosphate diphosphokinase [Nanoarchaeota archaeon]|nr:ribose-phosphate diphosphokinase [Nanoarchaeota archaeon]